jgi:hypothetical protein
MIGFGRHVVGGADDPYRSRLPQSGVLCPPLDPIPDVKNSRHEPASGVGSRLLGRQRLVDTAERPELLVIDQLEATGVAYRYGMEVVRRVDRTQELKVGRPIGCGVGAEINVGLTPDGPELQGRRKLAAEILAFVGRVDHLPSRSRLGGKLPNPCNVAPDSVHVSLLTAHRPNGLDLEQP